MRNSGFHWFSPGKKLCRGNPLAHFSVRSAIHPIMRSLGSHLWPSMDLLGPKQKRTHSICQRTFVRNRAKPNMSSEVLRRQYIAAGAEYSLLVCYIVLLESLQKLAPWRMLRSSRSTKSYREMITCATIFHGELIPKRHQNGCVCRVSYFFKWSLCTRNKGNHMPKISYKRCSSNLAV